MAMTLKAPGHAVWLRVIDHRHLVHFAVTTVTADPAIDVGGVIVKNVIRCAMKLHPFDRFPGLPTGPHWFQFRIIFLHLLVTIHAGLRVRKIGVSSDVDKAVTVAAIHAEL